MLDLFGREVKRGDIIVFSDNNRVNQVKYTTARLGVINNVLPKRTYNKGSAKYNKITKKYYSAPGLVAPDFYDAQPVISFYQLYEGDEGYNNGPSLPPACRKNGKPKRMVSLASQFIKINKEDLDDKWLAIYEGARKAFKI